jgi:hypothetical protein
MDSKGSQVTVRIYGDTAQERPVLPHTPKVLRRLPSQLRLQNRNLQISFPLGLWTGMKSSHKNTDRAQGSPSTATFQSLKDWRPQPHDQGADSRRNRAQSKPPQLLDPTVPPPSTADAQPPLTISRFWRILVTSLWFCSQKISQSCWSSVPG